MAGCASTSPQRGDVIGTLRVSGPNVLLDNRPGRDGDGISIGSTLVTGPGSSARVEFRGGGVFQLDENTDPVFGFIDQAKCILIRIFKGQAYLNKGHACVEGPDLSMVLNSEASIVIGQRQAEVTLLKGSAKLRQPEAYQIQPGQQISISQAQLRSVRTLSRAELKALVAWREKYTFQPLPPPIEPAPFEFDSPRPFFRFPQERKPDSRRIENPG